MTIDGLAGLDWSQYASQGLQKRNAAQNSSVTGWDMDANPLRRR